MEFNDYMADLQVVINQVTQLTNINNQLTIQVNTLTIATSQGGAAIETS